MIYLARWWIGFLRDSPVSTLTCMLMDHWSWIDFEHLSHYPQTVQCQQHATGRKLWFIAFWWAVITHFIIPVRYLSTGVSGEGSSTPLIGGLAGDIQVFLYSAAAPLIGGAIQVFLYNAVVKETTLRQSAVS